MSGQPQFPDRTDPLDLDCDGDRLREECGVFGIFGHPDAAAITALGLHALQHRGQEAAGIVSFDGTRFHSERRMGLVGDNFSRREVIDRLPGTMAIGPRALFDHRRDHPAQRAAAVLRARRRRLRGRPQRQPDQRPDPAPPARARRRADAVDHRHRGHPASGRALEAQPLHRPLHRWAARARRLLRLRGADQQEADRRPRSARHPSAGDRHARRPSDLRVGDLRARHHRRELRPRRRERRDRGVRRSGHAFAQAVPADGAAAVHLRIHLFRSPRIR